MKNKHLLYLVMALAILTSCSQSFYQVYKVKTDNQLETSSNALIYEDDNCIVTYNLWAENGNIGFRFFNKTDENILLNLEKSFFILGDNAEPYYQGRTFSYSSAVSKSASNTVAKSGSVSGFNYFGLFQTNAMAATSSLGATASSGGSVSYKEPKVVIVPPNSSTLVSEFEINDALVRDCKLFKYPKAKQINTVSFNEAESPVKFANRITYSLEGATEEIVFANHFYISEVTNLPAKDVFGYEYEEFCGQKGKEQISYMKPYAPNKFFIQYTKGTDSWKH